MSPAATPHPLDPDFSTTTFCSLFNPSPLLRYCTVHPRRPFCAPAQGTWDLLDIDGLPFTFFTGFIASWSSNNPITALLTTQNSHGDILILGVQTAPPRWWELGSVTPPLELNCIISEGSNHFHWEVIDRVIDDLSKAPPGIPGYAPPHVEFNITREKVFPLATDNASSCIVLFLMGLHSESQ
ncbi:hypothetical protein BKA70DRAFT_1441551 [Coprinopsis sp. MPI-PUGE-AT-0042]|nr:hypothetical protein BKA70DRAFT_1441551 [Coprinopsis sp. MPI-PUGE-AT-0042]